jgi:hypothetical protein
VTISRSPGNIWNTLVFDQTTSNGEGDNQIANVSPYVAEVALLRPGEPRRGRLSAAGRHHSVTFDHATFTNADNKTYPFETVLPGGNLASRRPWRRR